MLTTCPCRKVEQVSEETDALRVALDKHTGRQNRWVTAHQKPSGVHLLGVVQAKANLKCLRTSMWHMNNPCASCRKQVEEQQRQELLHRSNGAIDYAAQRDADSQGMSYVNISRRTLEEAFQTGTAVLQNMSGQRERLKVCVPCCSLPSNFC